MIVKAAGALLRCLSAIGCIIASKPLPDGYPTELTSIGDYLRKRRLDLGLLQREVGGILGVTENCITFWELKRSEPQIQYYPAIIDFLGFNPFIEGIDLNTLSGQIKWYRISKGLSHKKMGHLIGVDGSTISEWENEVFDPHPDSLIKLREVLSIS